MFGVGCATLHMLLSNIFANIKRILLQISHFKRFMFSFSCSLFAVMRILIMIMFCRCCSKWYQQSSILNGCISFYISPSFEVNAILLEVLSKDKKACQWVISCNDDSEDAQIILSSFKSHVWYLLVCFSYFCNLLYVSFGLLLYAKSSSSTCADSTDIHESFSPSISINHCSWKVLCIASSICTELIDVDFCWLTHTDMSMCKCP